ncbi:hypothetical protein PR002_g18416 [Phytophthora rubi]|uniref:Uncharacterized protein n=1 Tax=Phytophthora rubi TaxID=129364 RepID=A0A6A3K0D1_9STRA|nr:hypothetical protein PR002_g18416 [Phytophthora rubi]
MPRELRVKAKVNALAGSDSSDKDEPVESSEENQGSWRGPCAAQNAFRILGRPAVLPGSLRTEHAPGQLCGNHRVHPCGQVHVVRQAGVEAILVEMDGVSSTDRWWHYVCSVLEAHVHPKL